MKCLPSSTYEVISHRSFLIHLSSRKITHQNTLNFYGYITEPRFAIVTQWCEVSAEAQHRSARPADLLVPKGSTLYKHIHILDRHWKINQLIDIARQTCQGMSYVARHRDHGNELEDLLFAG